MKMEVNARESFYITLERALAIEYVKCCQVDFIFNGISISVTEISCEEDIWMITYEALQNSGVIRNFCLPTIIRISCIMM